MKKAFISISIILLVFSCEEYPTPGTQVLKQLNFQKMGANQWAESGDYLPDSVGIALHLASVTPPGNRQYTMEIEVLKGGGMVDQTLVHADKQGRMMTRWKVGNETNEQILKIKIYDSAGIFSAETMIDATAYFPNKLNTITKGLLVGIGDMVRDTINQRSMLISEGGLYNNKDKFYNWEPIYFPYGTNLKELEINSKGEVFAAGWNGNLYHSTDWGGNWTNRGKPIPDNPYNFELSITKDDYIWVNKWERGIYCSRDNGLTWQKDISELEKQERLGPVYSFADTAHMALALQSMMIMTTTDNGLTWTPIDTPQYSLSMFVTDENAIIAQNQNGFRLHKSTDGGNTFTQVFKTNVAFGGSSIHLFEKFHNYYYVLAPGGGVWKTRDFEEFEQLFSFTQQHNLFIDHRGAIYACGYNYVNAPPHPTLVLP